MLALAVAALLHVGVIDNVTLHDAARARDIPLRLYVPQDHGAHPLIIFSHGLGGSRTAYSYLADAWARAGYIVVLPTHHGSDTDAARAIGMIRLMRQSPDAWYRESVDRAADVHYILDHLPDMQREAGIAGAVDVSRIGVSGHSFGAHTTNLIAGATMILTGGTRKAFGDPRPRAFLAMSPQGESAKVFGFDEHSWDRIGRPFMAMSGSREPEQWNRQPYEHMRAGDKYEVIIDGASHLSFAGFDGERRLDMIVKTSLSFWNAYLRGDRAAAVGLRALASSRPAGMSVSAK